MSRIRRSTLSALLCALAASSMAQASWCDQVFKDTAGAAPVVVVARIDAPKDGPPMLAVVETLKGTYDGLSLKVESDSVDSLGLRDGDQVLLALTRERVLYGDDSRMGVCSATNVLPIRKGKLRSRDRPSYDSQTGSMKLYELKKDLQRHLSTPAFRPIHRASGDPESRGSTPAGQ